MRNLDLGFTFLINSCSACILGDFITEIGNVNSISGHHDEDIPFLDDISKAADEEVAWRCA